MASPSRQNGRIPDPGAATILAPFVSQGRIDRLRRESFMDPLTEQTQRFAAIDLIHDVRVAVHLPVRTFITACFYYLKYHLCVRSLAGDPSTAPIAALFLATKSEDTPKTSRELLCAAHNLKNPNRPEHPDAVLFEASSKRMLAVERKILHTAGFDMNSRYLHATLFQVITLFQKHTNQTSHPQAVANDLVKLTYDMSLDMFKTWVPLKQTSLTVAMSLVELALRMMDNGQADEVMELRLSNNDRLCGSKQRGAMVETMLDMLDLYTDHERSTRVGASHHPCLQEARLLQLKIDFNQEIDNVAGLARYTHVCATCAHTPLPQPGGILNARYEADAAPHCFGITVSFSSGHGRHKDGPNRYIFDREFARREADVVNAHFEDRYEEEEVLVEQEDTDMSSPAARAAYSPSSFSGRSHSLSRTISSAVSSYREKHCRNGRATTRSYPCKRERSESRDYGESPASGTGSRRPAGRHRRVR